MTSKRIKKKKKTSKFVALLLLFKNREKELYPKTNDIQNTRRVLSSGVVPLQKKREREKQNEEIDDLSFQSSFSCEKKIPLSREEKTQQTTSEKEKEKKRQNNNRRLTSSSQDGNTLYTHFGGFIHSQEKRILLFSSSSFEKRSEVFFPGGDFRND